MSAPKLKRLPYCTNCMRNFVVKGLDNFHGRNKRHENTRQPHLLKCGHSFCGDCLLQCGKGQSIISCPTCQCQSAIPEDEDGGDSNLLTHLPVDMYTLALLLANRTSQNAGDELKVSFIPAGMTVKPKSQYRASEKLCEECLCATGILKCKQCTFVFCSACFSKVHHQSKALSRHEAVPVYTDSGCRLASTCPEHCRPIEFYCLKDEEYVCSHCIIVGKHKGHGTVTTSDKNREVIDEVKATMPTARKVLKRLKVAEKELGAAVPQVQAGSTGLLASISSAFQQIHGILQVREHELVSDVQRLFSIHNSPAEKVKNEVSELLQFLKLLLRDAEIAITNPEDNYDVLEILKKLRQMCDQPCHLICVDLPQNKDSDVKFTADEDILGTLRRHGSITGQVQSKYKLLTLQEIQDRDNNEETNNNESFSSDDESSSVTSSLVTDNESVISDMSTRSSSIASGPKRKLSNISVLRQEIVFVTHVRDPTYFIVQRCSQMKKMDKLAKSINQWCNSNKTEQIDSVQPGELVLAKYSLDQKWYRSRIIGSVKIEDEGSGAGKEEPKAEIAYIDYGNSEVVPLSRLRRISPQFLVLQEQAIKCALHDIVPPSLDGEWSLEAAQTFLTFTGNKSVHMVVIEDVGNVLQVDLRKPSAEDIIMNDMPVSIRDALVFLGLACFSSSGSVRLERSTPPPQKQYYSCELPPKYATREVMVSHIQNPECFHVQQLGDHALFLNNLMYDLKEMYTSNRDDRWQVYCPTVGMPCVGQYFVDQQWYRVRVEKLPGNSMVTVNYVDYGNTEQVAWSMLRKIADKFMKLPAQAMLCSLADVAPLDPRRGWSNKATTVFRELVHGKPMKIYVHSVLDSGLIVSLYEVLEDRDVCINALLVKKGLAKSTGSNSTIVDYPKAEQEPVKDVQPMKAVDLKSSTTTTNDGTAPGPAFLLSKKKRSPLKKAPAMVSPQKKALLPTPLMAIPIAAPLPTTVPPSLDTTKKSSVTLPGVSSPGILVTVAHVQSPACLYVRQSGTDIGILDTLMADMARVYSAMQPSEVEWKEAGICAVRYSKDGHWYRATIQQILDDGTAKVVLFDYGFEDEVHLSQLHPLMQKHQKERKFAVCCHLVDVQPAGDKNCWSSVAIEFLKDFVSKYEKMYIVKKAELKAGSLPVDLLVEIEEQGGALEPSRTIYVSVSQKLREQGLALPVRNRITTPRATQRVEPATSHEIPDSPCETEPPKLAGYETPLSACATGPLVPAGYETPPSPSFPGSPIESSPSTVRQGSVLSSPSTPSATPRPTMNEFAEVLSTEIGKLHVGSPTNGGSTHSSPVHFSARFASEASIMRKVSSVDNVASFQKVNPLQPKSEVNRTTKDKCDDLDAKVKTGYGDSEQCPESCVAEIIKSLAEKLGANKEAKIIQKTNKKKKPTNSRFSPKFPQMDGVGNGPVGDGASCASAAFEGVAAAAGSSGSGLSATLLPTQHWKAPEMPNVATFRAMPTHVDYNCNIYLHELVEAPKKLAFLKNTLNQKFLGSEPQNHDLYWFPGDACVAKFCLDGGWYRARVVSVDDDAVEVQFIDFGNFERMKATSLRKQLIMTNIPQQCLKCKLHGIEPVSQEWPVPVLDFIHNNIVEQEATVTLMESPVPGRELEISLLTSHGITLEDMLVDMQYAYKFKVPSPKRQPVIVDSSCPYERPQLPQVGESVPVVVSFLVGSDVYVQRNVYDNPQTQEERMMNFELGPTLQKFLDQNVALEITGDHLPQLENPAKGDAVCCKYSLDNSWYRGLILDARSDGMYQVLFVDYGNTELAAEKDLRQLPVECLVLPMQGIHCQLHQVVAANGQWNDELHEQMFSALNQPDTVYCAHFRIVNLDSPAKVDIYKNRRGGSGQEAVLAYQHLIDNGLIELVRIKGKDELNY